MQERKVEANFWRDANLVREIARKALFDKAERAVVLQFIAQAESLASPDLHAQRAMPVAAHEQGSRPAVD
jgi:hypothetical protein